MTAQGTEEFSLPFPPSQPFSRLGRQARRARAGDKQEAREGDYGNEHRARAGSDRMEKERKGKPEVAS